MLSGRAWDAQDRVQCYGVLQVKRARKEPAAAGSKGRAPPASNAASNGVAARIGSFVDSDDEDGAPAQPAAGRFASRRHRLGAAATGAEGPLALCCPVLGPASVSPGHCMRDVDAEARRCGPVRRDRAAGTLPGAVAGVPRLGRHALRTRGVLLCRARRRRCKAPEGDALELA